MVQAPDHVLLELFQIIPEKLPPGDYKDLGKISLKDKLAEGGEG